MKVQLSTPKCQGHGRCYDLAPQVFGEDEEGYGQVLGDGTVAPEHERLAVLALKNCPEDAIDVVKESTAVQVGS